MTAGKVKSIIDDGSANVISNAQDAVFIMSLRVGACSICESFFLSLALWIISWRTSVLTHTVYESNGGKGLKSNSILLSIRNKAIV